MRRFAADLPSVLRYLLLALILIAIYFFLRWLDKDVSSPDEPTTPIHVKFRPDHVHGLGLGEHPLFTTAHVHSLTWDGVVDPRDLWVRIEVPRSRADEVLARLASDPAVDEAFVPPTVTLPRRPVVPPDHPVISDDGPSCPITTPSYESYQGYVGPAPKGIDAPAAWTRGVRGQGIWFADVEGGWNAKHEDLPGDRITHVSGKKIEDPMWRAHGTAVLGEVVGRDNGKGVVGLAPDVERVFTSSIGRSDVPEAIDAAAERLRPGDVLLIELQGAGPRGRYLPVEFWDDNFDAIKAATDRGVVIIEAAGNGAENLDHPAYKQKFDRWQRDSGAIMVGAGAPARDGWDDRARLDFSNY